MVDFYLLWKEQTLSNQRLHHLVRNYNRTPCQCFGYATLAETVINHVLHLKCESTGWDLETNETLRKDGTGKKDIRYLLLPLPAS